MLAIIVDGVPTETTIAALTLDLYRVGYTSRAGTLYTPQGEPWGALPNQDITAPVTLPDGRRVYPVVEIPPALADDQGVTGWELVMAGDHVERRAVVVTIPRPPLPDLATLKTRAQAEVRAAAEAARVEHCPTGKEIDIRRLASGYTVEDVARLDQFIDGTLRLVSAQAVIEIETATSPEALTEIMADYRALYGQEVA